MTTYNLALYPYHPYSRGYKSLNKALELPLTNTSKIEKIYLEGNQKKGTIRTLINWGSGNISSWLRDMSGTIINPTKAVNICGDKVKFFNTMKVHNDGARTPEFTTDLDEAMKWLEEGRMVMGRMSRGSCGDDITFYEDDPERFQKSEFWSIYQKKLHEFRIHVFNGEIISEQKKAIRLTNVDGTPIDPASVDKRIRNHKNGYIFKRNEITIPEDVRDQALRAVRAIPDLTFGAVDVIYNNHEDRAYVLEVNTAPGLEGTTLDDYVSAFKTYL